MLKVDPGQSPLRIQAITVSMGDMKSGQTVFAGSARKSEVKPALKKTESKTQLKKAEPRTPLATHAEAASAQSQGELQKSGKMQAQVQGDDLAVQIEIHPSYPRISRKLSEEGQVLLQLNFSGEGHLLEARLLKSSGFPRLDEAALIAAQKGVFHFNSPLTNNVKKNVNIVFKLNE
ncbi:MAG: energy transducer TonB [Bdellovibrionia bacterium]